MNKTEIYQQIRKTKKEFERRKIKRAIYTVLFYTAALLQVFYWQDQFGHNFLDILCVVILCLILSLIAFLINTGIFQHLFTTSQAEEKALESLRKQLEEKEEKPN